MIQIEIEKGTLIAIEKQLDSMGKQAVNVLKKSVNDTARKSRKKMVAEARKTYTVNAAKLNQGVKVKSATNGHLIAYIRIAGRPLPIKNFRITNGRFGVKAKVKKENALKELTLPGAEKSGKDLKAFIATMRSGHTGVWQRRPGTKTRNGKEALKQFYGNSVPKMLGNEKNMRGTIEPFIIKTLRESIDMYIAKTIGG